MMEHQLLLARECQLIIEPYLCFNGLDTIEVILVITQSSESNWVVQAEFTWPIERTISSKSRNFMYTCVLCVLKYQNL